MADCRGIATKNVTMAVCGQEMRDRTGLAMSSGVGGLVFALVAYTVRIASKVDFSLSNAHPGASNFWLDDFAITLAVIIVTTFSAITVPLANIGFGKDIWTVEFPKITKILKLFFAEEMLYVSGLGIVKISMLLTYLRFFSSPTFRKAVFVLIVLNAIYVVVFMSMVALQCRPLSYTWYAILLWHSHLPHPLTALGIDGTASTRARVSSLPLSRGRPLLSILYSMRQH